MKRASWTGEKAQRVKCANMITQVQIPGTYIKIYTLIFGIQKLEKKICNLFNVKERKEKLKLCLWKHPKIKSQLLLRTATID